MITITSTGSFDRTEKALGKMARGEIFKNLEKFAQVGVDALRAATPVDSGVSAMSWGVKVSKKRGGYSIEWTNNHVVAGAPIVILLQYGHGTGTGGYVRGRDFINPAIKPIFDQISADVWKAVTSA